jgi:hypothetical protein
MEAVPMNAYDCIRKKRSGLSLDEPERRLLIGAHLRGGALFEIHARDEDTARIAARRIESAIAISRGPVPRAPLYPMDD